MNIPNEHEAAIIEGANKWQLFSKITMPYMLFMTTPLGHGFVATSIISTSFTYSEAKPCGAGECGRDGHPHHLALLAYEIAPAL